ncbi:MAG: hypothetical protein ACYSUC_00310 [Planctomycetota bacterium]
MPAYVLSTYLFYLPWLPSWQSSFQDDTGLIVWFAQLTVLLSPLVFPLAFGMIVLEVYLEVSETYPFLALGVPFLFLFYYGVVLTVSVFIVRLIAKRLRRWLLTNGVSLEYSS